MEIIEIKIANYETETPELRKKFEELGLQAFDSLHFQFKQMPAGVYHVDTKHIFDNQYNTVEGFRVFEKCSCLQNRTQKPLSGYFISSGIEEIRAYQNRVKVCGYCGAQYLDSEKSICDKCLGSEYLKEDELHLLKLLPVLESFGEKRKLTSQEMVNILPKYKEAQGLGNIKRAEAHASKNRKMVAALIPKAKEKASEIIKEAEIETAAYTWLLDHEINILDNVIYYTHTRRFGFGWRNPIDPAVKSSLLDKLCEFPFDYDIK